MKPKAQIFAANETLELQCEDTAETLGKQYKADSHKHRDRDAHCTRYSLNFTLQLLNFPVLTVFFTVDYKWQRNQKRDGEHSEDASDQ